ncbi:hypothetical protein [Streptomyces sp. NBC_01089]|uniref:hypothetical protein n=1 Tax=Streptomyces sp. NBC_01089 TaxID=2903747 RepID=UPI0038709648|nr:hypothetical protein OG510_03135 [Streptomyces sp. NBC_01089]
MADYECFPLWVSEPNLENLAPNDKRLGLSVILAERLTEWSDEFDEVINLDDPASSKFSSKGAEHLFVEKGERIAQDLLHELGPDWRVYYHDIRSGVVQEISNV